MVKAVLFGYRTLYHVDSACAKARVFMVPKVVSISALTLVSDLGQSNSIEIPLSLETSLRIYSFASFLDPLGCHTKSSA
jgi:hypothetical protein